jgi:hypothetical protein
LSIPVTGKAGERPLFNNKNTAANSYHLTLQRPKYFEAISGSA